MEIFNNREVEGFVFDCCQMGGTANTIKGMVNGEMINIAWQNSITGEVMAIQWDYMHHETVMYSGKNN